MGSPVNVIPASTATTPSFATSPVFIPRKESSSLNKPFNWTVNKLRFAEKLSNHWDRKDVQGSGVTWATFAKDLGNVALGILSFIALSVLTLGSGALLLIREYSYQKQNDVYNQFQAAIEKLEAEKTELAETLAAKERASGNSNDKVLEDLKDRAEELKTHSANLANDIKTLEQDINRLDTKLDREATLLGELDEAKWTKNGYSSSDSERSESSDGSDDEGTNYDYSILPSLNPVKDYGW